jgi:hypothetical protein
MNNVCEISSFIDILIDDFVVSRKKPKASFIKFLQSEDIDRRTINNFIENKTDFIEVQIKELELAMNGLDPQVKEGYGNFRKPELREFKEMLEQIVDDLYSYKDSKKIVRKRKSHSPDKIVKYIKLIDTNYEFDGNVYKSLCSTEIIGAKHVFLYNIETRELTYYAGRSLNVKRTMVIDFDPDKSWVRKLRKPEEFLPEVNSCTKYNIENISTHLTTKPKRPTGRTNSKQILLKVIK